MPEGNPGKSGALGASIVDIDEEACVVVPKESADPPLVSGRNSTALKSESKR
jgi:hypothetical protein